MKKYYEDSETNPNYRICWCGPENNRVYVSWFFNGRQWVRLGVFSAGTNEERNAAAKQAWRDHFETKKAG